jgi:hypothetical protein
MSHILYTSSELKADESYNQKRSFHGPPVFLRKNASFASDTDNDSNKIVLSDHIDSLRVDEKSLQQYKAPKEKFNEIQYVKQPPHQKKSYVDLDELDHGEVLFESDTLKPNLDFEMKTNVVGNRETERFEFYKRRIFFS